MNGILFVVTAPSGAGKSSLIRAVLAHDARLQLSVSYTTRPPRPGEVDGRDYHFVDDSRFLHMLERGEFLECAEVHGFRYGTAHSAMRSILAGGSDLVLEIDWQGAQQVRKLHPQCIGIFILPPSLGELERRLRARGQDTEEVIERRMANAFEEVSHAPEFDYAIINKEFEFAKQDLLAIMRAERLRTPHQLEHYPQLFHPTS